MRAKLGDGLRTLHHGTTELETAGYKEDLRHLVKIGVDATENARIFYYFEKYFYDDESSIH